MGFKVGDCVYVPNAYDTIWKPWLTKIEEIINDKYLCEIKYKNYSSFNGDDHVVKREFDKVFGDPLSCREYIADYYYSGLCRNCMYEKDAGTILNCSMCRHNIKVDESDPVKWNWGYCKFTEIPVWSARCATRGSEICRNFSPALPQYEDWSWERYENLLKNCDFNPGCVHHRESCHKTCSFEKYMDEYISVPWEIEYEGRKTSYALVKRQDWVDQNFLTDDGHIICWGLKLKPKYTKTGKLKKGTVNQVVVFTEKALI